MEIDPKEIVQELRREIARDGYKAVAARTGVSMGGLHKVANYVRPLSVPMARKLGYSVEIVYRRRERGTDN